MLRNIVILVIAYYLGILLWRHFEHLNNSRGINIYFVDVGQGDAVFIEGPDKSTMLVDGGYDFRLDMFIDTYFKAPLCIVDLVFLTHPHLDHFGGIEPVINRCKISMVMFNDVDFPSAGFVHFVGLIRNKFENKNYYSGQKIVLGNMHIYILWPSLDYLNFSKSEYLNDLNLISGVLLIDYGNFEVLLTGDAEENILTQLDWSRYKPIIQDGLDVLKVPHHGSTGGVSLEMLALLKPKLCVISVGEGNSYKHPHSTTLSLLKSGCRAVLRTDLHGTIELNSEEVLSSEYDAYKRYFN